MLPQSVACIHYEASTMHCKNVANIHYEDTPMLSESVACIQYEFTPMLSQSVAEMLFDNAFRKAWAHVRQCFPESMVVLCDDAF